MPLPSRRANSSCVGDGVDHQVFPSILRSSSFTPPGAPLLFSHKWRWRRRHPGRFADQGLGRFWLDRKTRIAIVNCGAHNKNDFTAPEKAIRTHYLALVAVPASVALVDLVDPALVLADLLLGALASPQGHLHGLLEGLASFF